MNFLAVGYAYSDGSLPDNPGIELEDADLNVQAALFVYVRVIEMFGQSGKVDMVIPTVCIDGDAIYKGDYTERNVCGVGDIKGRFSLNLYGAPALSLKEYAAYEQDLIVGVSLQVTAPTGQYDASKLVNIGTNRWALKPSIGVSQAFGPLAVELSAAAELYTTNSDFWGGMKRKQESIYSTQTHFIYTFMPGLWLGLDANYYWGGETFTNGVGADDTIGDSRFGVTLALPVNRANAVKFYNNSGISTRTGTDYNMFGFAWQYRFMDGF